MAIEDYYSDMEIFQQVDDDFNGSSYVSLGIYKGKLQPISGNELFREGKAGEQSTHRCYTAVETPAGYGFKVVQNSVSYKMYFAIQPDGISSQNHHKEILCGLFE